MKKVLGRYSAGCIIATHVVRLSELQVSVIHCSALAVCADGESSAYSHDFTSEFGLGVRQLEFLLVIGNTKCCRHSTRLGFLIATPVASQTTVPESFSANFLAISSETLVSLRSRPSRFVNANRCFAPSSEI